MTENDKHAPDPKKKPTDLDGTKARAGNITLRTGRQRTMFIGLLIVIVLVALLIGLMGS
ncbi:MAG: hypothetical protein ACE363_10135 [Alphaproteobacteria bacterium]